MFPLHKKHRMGGHLIQCLNDQEFFQSLKASKQYQGQLATKKIISSYNIAYVLCHSWMIACDIHRKLYHCFCVLADGNVFDDLICFLRKSNLNVLVHILLPDHTVCFFMVFLRRCWWPHSNTCCKSSACCSHCLGFVSLV